MKDLCYRYNSNLHKSATAAFRPTIAAQGGGNKKSNGDNKKWDEGQREEGVETITRVRIEKQLWSGARPAVLPTEVRKAWGFDKDSGYELSGDEPEVYEEEDVGDIQKHKALRDLAEQDLKDSKDYRKDCSMDKEDGEHMGTTDIVDTTYFTS